MWCYSSPLEFGLTMVTWVLVVVTLSLASVALLKYIRKKK
jgi:hypothetical protein